MEFNQLVREVVSEEELNSFFEVFSKIQLVIDQFQETEVNKPIFEL